jgi:hypothetical protein
MWRIFAFDDDFRQELEDTIVVSTLEDAMALCIANNACFRHFDLHYIDDILWNESGSDCEGAMYE